MANTENSHGDNNHNTEHTQGHSCPPRREFVTKAGRPGASWGNITWEARPTIAEIKKAFGGDDHRTLLALKGEIPMPGPPTGSLAAVQNQSFQHQFAAVNAANAASSPPVPAPAPAFSYPGRTKPPAKKRKAPVESTDAPATKKTKASVDSTDALATKEPNSGKPWTREASKLLLDHKVRGGVWDNVCQLLGRTNQACRLRMLTFSKATGFSAGVTQQEQDAHYAKLKNWEKKLADDFAQAYKAAHKNESVEPAKTTRRDSHQQNTPVGGHGNEQQTSSSHPPSPTGFTSRTMTDVTEARRSELARWRNSEGFRSQESYDPLLPDHQYSKKSPTTESNTAAASPSTSDSENNTSAEINAAEALLSLSDSEKTTSTEVNAAASTPATSVAEEDQNEEAKAVLRKED